MRKGILFLFQFTILISLVFLFDAKAATNCCVNHGGEYACDYTNGTLYCKDGTKSTDCRCRIINTPTPTFTPVPSKTPTPSIPKCVANSTYDKTSKNCRCDSGYTVSENSCITYQQYCWKNFGGNSSYSESKNACICKTGYLWSIDNSTCVTYTKICQNELGEKSYYKVDDNTCNCYSGYSIQDGKCKVIPTISEAQVTQTTKKVLPTPTIKPEPTIEKKEIASATPTVVLNVDEAKIIKNEDEQTNFISEENESSKNIVTKLFDFFKNLISNIFSQ